METLVQPRTPARREILTLEDAAASLKEIQRWTAGMANFNDSLYNILHSGYLVRSFRVESLEAGKIGAGTITTNQLFLGSDNFVLDGVLSQMRIEDDQNPPVVRVEIGAFGSGSDYGIKVRDASGAVVFQSASTTFINGAVITNATISDSKIIGMNGSKLTDGSVADSKIANLSAGKITAGTLIVDGSPAIQVTSSGACVFQSGGDIIMRASAAGDNNFISWRTSGNAERANAMYNATTNIFTLQSSGGAVLSVQSAALLALQGATQARIAAPTITIGLNATQNMVVTARLASSILLDGHNSRSIGQSGTRLANVWSVLVNGADYCYENGYRMTEANHVWSWMKPEDGWVLMNDFWKPILFIDRAGNATFAGKVSYGHLPDPDVPRREPRGENDATDRKTLN